MDTDRMLPHQTVVVRGGRIAALGPTKAVTVPNGTEQIDGRGKYLMPGLGACHGHIMNFGAPPSDPRQTELALLLLLSDGVTVLRNVDYWDKGDSRLSGQDLLGLRQQAAAGHLWSPRLYIAGQWGPKRYLGLQTHVFPDSADVWPEPRLDSVAAYVAAYQAAGYDFIKLHEESPEMADSVFAAARRVGIQVGGHVITYDIRRAIAGGQKVADHTYGIGGWPTNEEDPTYPAQIAANAGLRRRNGVWSCIGGYFDKDSLILRALHDSAAGFLLGDDGTSGLGSLPQMVHDSRLTPYQVLVGATKNFAQYLRTLDPHGDETGTIAVGQRADLLLLTRNPLADVSVLANDSAEVDMLTSRGTPGDFQPSAQTDPVVVMVGGRWLGRAELNRRVAVVQQYDKLSREERRDSELWSYLQTDSGTTTMTRQALDQLISRHRAERLALASRFALAPSSPAGGADSVRGPQLLAELFAHQLGEVRAALPPTVQSSFDEPVRAWLARRAQDGYHVTVPGVSP